LPGKAYIDAAGAGLLCLCGNKLLAFPWEVLTLAVPVHPEIV
jgi:hypothetical protein